ncbi:hypothetical protein J699_00663 [Acinetobacter sp. 1000160]|nr:hypothetical protein J537_1236 [Acinetobacter baumannii 1437282]EXB46826.1 hypothetical protein J522_2394 [Acinetobacter baumannii 146457]EYT23526.1 hypothetical protein J699_00663 [Acinetobacter sp. 1000160]
MFQPNIFLLDDLNIKLFFCEINLLKRLKNRKKAYYLT